MTTSHIDTFVRDRLPPPEAQPEFLFDLPELHYPDRFNAAVELIDKGDPDALAVLNDAGSWTYGEMRRSEEHTSELQSLMRISYAVFCLKKKQSTHTIQHA